MSITTEYKKCTDKQRSTYSFAKSVAGLLHTRLCPKAPLVSARPGTSLALLVPLGHPVSRAQRAVVLGILLTLFVVLTLLRFAPETMKRRWGSGRKDIC